MSDEIYNRQNELKRKIKLARKIINEYDLPLVSLSDTPILFIALGMPRVGYNLLRRLLNDGFFTNIGIFPTVPINCTGLRLPITLGQTDDDLRNVLSAIKYHFPKVLEEENINIKTISRSFKMPFVNTIKRYDTNTQNVDNNDFNIQHETDINKIDKDLWDSLLGDNGIFDWEGCKFIQEVFKDNPEPENNWNMHYLIIKDNNNDPVLATFFSELLCKDDMTASEDVSRQIEEKRKQDKYYLCSKVIMMGSLITEGNHMYLNRKSELWQKAIVKMVKIMEEVKNQCGASMIQLRDFDTDDTELKDFLIKEGFVRIDLPETHIVKKPKSLEDYDIFLYSLSVKSRYHIRKHMIDNEHLFECSSDNSNNNHDINHFYKLYLNIKANSYKINTFDIPKKFFEKAIDHDRWETLTLRLKINNQLCCFILSYKNVNNGFCPMIIGIDYKLNKEFSCYRQGLFQLYKRATKLKSRKIYLGMDASVEKKKLEAAAIRKSLFLRADDNFSMELISTLKQKK